MRKAHTLLWAAVLGIALSGTALHAQQANLANLPSNTVVGRLGSGLSGSAQSITFAQLLAQLNGLNTVIGGPATTVVGDVMLWNNVGGTLAKDSGVAMSGSGTIAMGSANTLTLSGSMTLTGGGTTNVASGKTLTDTSGIGAVIALGATGGGFAAYAGATCTNQAITILSTAGAPTCLPQRAATNKTITSPAGPNSTSVFTMQGLAGTITPTVSGNIQVTISGTIITTSTTAGNGIQYQISHGTSTAPTTNAALTGTQDGTVQQWDIPVVITAADSFIPFSISVVVTGLTVGTAYWIDLAAEGVGNTNQSFSKVNIAAVEL